MDALRGFALLLLCQSAGEALSRLAHLPLPGPVVGLLLMWALLNLEAVRRPVAAAAEPLLGHLSLLFVPVGVGVITHVGLVSQYGGRMLGVIVLSTWVGLAVTALVLRATGGDADPEADDPAPAGVSGSAPAAPGARAMRSVAE